MSIKPPSALSELVEALRALPGVGPKSAQRIAYHLMQHDREGAERLGRSLLFATEHLRHCEKCNTFTEAQVCEVCSDPGAIRRCCASSRRPPIRSCSSRR